MIRSFSRESGQKFYGLFKSQQEARDIMLNHQYEQQIIEKLRALPPGQVAEVEDFVDFLRSRSEVEIIGVSFTLFSETLYSTSLLSG